MAHPLPFIKYVDSAFTADKTRNCELRIQLSSEELILAVFNYLADQFLLIEKYPVANSYNKVKPFEAMARILQTHSLTRLPFKRVEIIPVTPTWTMVPNDLFDENHLKDVLQLGAEVNHTDPVGLDILPGGDMKIAYSWPQTWKNVIENQFEDYSIRHFSGILAGILLRNSKQDSVIYAHVHGFQVDLFALKDGKPLLFNSYAFQSPEDFLYFVALAYEQLSFNREIAPLYLIGEIEEGSAIYQLCYRYIRNIHFLERPGNSSIPDGEADTPPLQDHALFNLLHPFDANY